MSEKRPNFLVIVADDLGFSDCGCFGSEIQTPNIDRLAAESNAARFANYHVAAACSPTRAMLMTGTDHHIAGFGELQEMTRSSPAHRGQPGHEGYLNDRVVALPELLSDGGYFTCMSGKWHLGIQPDHHPFKRGFKKSFTLLPGCANHYAFEPDYEDPKHEPMKFFETATRALHAEDDHFVEKLPDDFYSSDAYADRLIEYLDGRSITQNEQPFFAYLPFSAPHWPLQAPKETCDKYRGLYNDGPEALRQKRLARLKDLGMVDKDVKPHPVVFTDGKSEEWSELPEEIRQSSSRAMEVYAGMVDRMDYNIGRVIDHLKQSGEYDNTFVLFMSDNGAEGASFEASPLVGQSIVDHVNKYYDNSLDNIGRGNSFVWYGCRWAQAATAPSRLFKMHSTEGGCRVPLIVKPPSSGSPSNGTNAVSLQDLIPATDAFCTVMDIVPTILQYAQLQHPGTVYRGREIAPLRGKSWVDFFSNGTHREPPSAFSETSIHGADYTVGFEVAGSGAIRQGDWKITYVPAPRGPQKWELFNIKTDPGETEDLAEAEPERREAMLEMWKAWKADVGSVGVKDEWPTFGEEERDAMVRDEFEDPYAWIKYIGRPEITPEGLRGRVPGTHWKLR